MSARITKYIISGLVLSLTLGLIIISCSSPNNSSNTTSASLDDLYNAAASINGWTEGNEQRFNFTAENLHFKINGGDYSYIKDSTLKEGYFATLQNASTGAYLEYFVFDYNTQANAKKEFDYLVQKRIVDGGMTEVNIAGFNSSSVRAAEVGGGIQVYAYFNKYYFEMTFSGYNSTSDAANDAAIFLNKFKSKI